MDVLAVEDAVRRDAGHVRQEGTPRFLELRTYRYRAHSMADPDLYRTKEEIETWKTRDPIARLRATVVAAGILSAADVEGLDAAVVAEIDAAVAAAETGPWEAVEDLTKDVHTPVSR
jgi:TPP-dependent pyruvate/acetoin dehydrogenase alpha subunit